MTLKEVLVYPVELLKLIWTYKFPFFEYELSIFNVMVMVFIIRFIVWFISSAMGGTD